MENAVITIIFMAIVGAIIGGFTNFLAIKMLFRPYNAIYLKKWRLPFTPGLIPKRRQELSKQIGITVRNYLLTPEVFRKKLFNEDIKSTVLEFAGKKIEGTLFTDEKTIYDWLKQGGFEQLPDTIEQRVDVIIEKQFHSMRNTLSTKSIDALLPSNVHEVIDRKIPEVVTYILEKGEEYFLSPKGEATIKNMMDDFLGSKGSFGGMIQMFLGDSASIVTKIQRELINFLKAPGTKHLLVNIISQEWDKLKQQPIMNYLEEVDFDSILSNIKGYAKKELNIREHLNQPIRHYWPQGNDYVKHDLLPKLVEKGFKEAKNKLEDVVNRLNLDEVVREQVDSFPLEKLEELVLSIASKELKMITILGAVLGGLIGIVQGLIVFLLN
ncbi:DUF445 domain-containing protein [Ureibacillus chungkukjangi]|uniref:Uncharacterized membrane protein YheB (UPF0754 family) n=1 Tax=Ureibacillus chungkukjangi TaxID=1202712 RepID=A0A318TH88_9BACL|nr:DUF445 family protein [Ureibacillus chungkukjangi]PYF04221.1 uncharacterized membrane protein YheB (UPF0754 family) [Ureibacillus chungkukjangi]